MCTMEEVDIISSENNDFQSNLELELETLCSIFVHELDVKREGEEFNLLLQLHPSTADKVDEQFVRMTLEFKIPKEYPEIGPEIIIRNTRGLSDEKINKIFQNLLTICDQKRGSPMLFELIQLAKEEITANNKPNEECAICLYGFLEGDSFMKTDCYHYFHCHCLTRYVEHKFSNEEKEESFNLEKDKNFAYKVPCPVCRMEINVSEFDQNFPEPIAVLNAPMAVDYALTEEMKKFDLLYQKQLEQGGIIDVEAENQKFLLEISSFDDSNHVAAIENFDEAENISLKELNFDSESIDCKTSFPKNEECKFSGHLKSKKNTKNSGLSNSQISNLKGRPIAECYDHSHKLYNKESEITNKSTSVTDKDLIKHSCNTGGQQNELHIDYDSGKTNSLVYSKKYVNKNHSESYKKKELNTKGKNYTSYNDHFQQNKKPVFATSKFDTETNRSNFKKIYSSPHNKFYHTRNFKESTKVNNDLTYGQNSSHVHEQMNLKEKKEIPKPRNQSKRDNNYYNCNDKISYKNSTFGTTGNERKFWNNYRDINNSVINRNDRIRYDNERTFNKYSSYNNNNQREPYFHNFYNSRKKFESGKYDNNNKVRPENKNTVISETHLNYSGSKFNRQKKNFDRTKSFNGTHIATPKEEKTENISDYAESSALSSVNVEIEKNCLTKNLSHHVATKDCASERECSSSNELVNHSFFSVASHPTESVPLLPPGFANSSKKIIYGLPSFKCSPPGFHSR